MVIDILISLSTGLWIINQYYYDECLSLSESWKVAVGIVVPVVFICIIAIAVILLMSKSFFPSYVHVSDILT